MDISVIIVNYNVKYFLEQCLQSVFRARKDRDIEIIVVDNNSVDGSQGYIRERFPDVKLIANKKNVGFSQANNQGIKESSGKYVLLLNPDTVIREDTLQNCFSFMEKHEEAGALGVKMIDGKGNFLPESKRSLPTPEVSFYKIFGLSRLFPKSKRFGKYHLGHLDKDKTHEVEILSGAFMFMRKSALDKIGYLDENFFMYGEDIDLSYRFILAGYKNYYFSDTTIIHYKGESSKKDSVNYVMIFYNAMLIFARKHFSGGRFRLYSGLINLAIYFRATLSVLKRMVYNLTLPLLDFGLTYLAIYFISNTWSKYLFGSAGQYPPEFLYGILPGYLLIWLVSVFFSGGYDKPFRPGNSIKGILVGGIIVLLGYALLPENLRYSRALILMSGMALGLFSVFNRFILSLLRFKELPVKFFSKPQKIALVAGPEEAERIREIIHKTELKTEITTLISPFEEIPGISYAGKLDQISEIVRINKIDEIIFSAGDLTSAQIITQMLHLSDRSVNFKIAPRDSMTIIGSNSIDTSGDLYAISINSIGSRINKRKKRLLDAISSALLLLLSPLIILFYRNKKQLLVNAGKVFTGEKTWVGYHPGAHPEHEHLLPVLQPGILYPGKNTYLTDSPGSAERINFIYARDYSLRNDLIILMKNINQLDQNPNKNVNYQKHRSIH